MKRDVNILCYGGGVNSVALLIESSRKGIIFDAILFADPGAEKKQSYLYTAMMNKWCKEHDQPEITTVKQVDKNAEFIGLYRDCIERETLPSLAFGFKSCSQKFKKFHQEKFCNNTAYIQAAIANGYKVYMHVGIDADEHQRVYGYADTAKIIRKYPLIEWDWARHECIECIESAGLPIPPKSSCTFCPAMKPGEIIELYQTDKCSFFAAVEMERNAMRSLVSVKGLGRDFSWWDLIVTYRYIERIKRYGPPKKFPKKLHMLAVRLNHAKKKNASRYSRRNMLSLFKSKCEIACDCYDG